MHSCVLAVSQKITGQKRNRPKPVPKPMDWVSPMFSCTATWSVYRRWTSASTPGRWAPHATTRGMLKFETGRGMSEFTHHWTTGQKKCQVISHVIPRSTWGKYVGIHVFSQCLGSLSSGRRLSLKVCAKPHS